MTNSEEKQALSVLEDYATRYNWHPKKEVPVFVAVRGERRGPFLNRHTKLLPISLRTAWALLRANATAVDGRRVNIGTYAEREPTVEMICGLSDLLRI